VDLNIASWNADGLNASKWKWITDIIKTKRIDILLITEVKGKKGETKNGYLESLTDFNHVINLHQPTFLHGVAFLWRKSVDAKVIDFKMDCPVRSDCTASDPTSGRVLALKLANFILVGTYTPNAGTGLKHLQYRINDWDPAFFKAINDLDKTKPVIWIGDINVAPTHQDVSHPQKMKKYAGFTVEERISFAKFLTIDWIDIWRHMNANGNEYTWKGTSTAMRLDNCIVSKRLLSCVSNPWIGSNSPSDHECLGLTVSVK
jgi:exodeoxyribonuclease III